MKQTERNIAMKTNQAKRLLPLLTAFLIAAAEYGWVAWYYGKLYRQGMTISVLHINMANLSNAFQQHLLVNLQGILLLLICIVVWKRQVPDKLGFSIKTKRGKTTALIALTVALATLAFALVSASIPVEQALYGWVYYLIFVAFFEELTFRAVLPWLMKKSSLPNWCEWLIPAMLFAAMHTMIPLITGGAPAVLKAITTNLIGLIVGGCAYYGLYRWTGNIWTPTLLHGVLDYPSLLI